MSNSRLSTANEKLTITGPDSKKAGWFTRQKLTKSVDTDEKGSEVAVVPPEPEAPPVSFTELFRFSTKFELLIDAIALVAAAAAGAAQPLMTLLFGNLTNEFVIFQSVVNQADQGDQQAINDLPAAAASFRHVASKDALYLVVIGISMFVCTYFYMYVWVYTAEINAKRIRERYLRAVLRQDIQFFDKVGAGEVATRIQTDTHLVQQGMSEKVALVVTCLSAFATGFILAYIRSWRLALALTSLLPCIAITGAVMNKAISKYMQLSLKHIANAGSIAEEVISTIRTVQAFGTQGILSGLYDQHIEKSKVVDVKSAIWLGGSLSILFFCVYSSYALAFSFGTTLILRGDADAGIVINVFMAILTGFFSLVLLAPEMQAITHGQGAAAKLYATIDRVPDIDSADPSGEKPETVFGEVTLEDVQFNYPSRPDIQVVKGISLTFQAGKIAALVGASGSGKSTVISLIERFHDPLSGVVKFDGRDLKSLNLRWLRSQIGLVSQEPTLFATTIRGNIEHGLIGTKYENASEEEKFALIKEACVKSNADGFITKLHLGYDTMVGERGFLLSGGQKQRVAIARAIVSDPRILLLDEATSALDTQSEGIVQDALEKAVAGRTTITIAHRLSTIKDADIIFVMGDGLVIEQGTHQELLQREGGAYARLVQAQRLRESDEVAAVAADADDRDDEPKDMEKAAHEEVPLGRRNTGQSLASQILEQKKKEQKDTKEPEHSMYYLFKRMGKINRSQWRKYFLGTIFATMTGMAYLAFGIVYAKAIHGFSFTGSELRHSGDRNALWFFIIAIISTLSIGMQNYLFRSSAAALMAKLRSLNFKAILRQDIEYFDRDEHSTGGLVSNLSENPQKVFGLAGATLAASQSISTLIVGSILGLIFIWKVGLVGIAVTPLLVSMGYIRLRVVVLKDQKNKKAHESSAQLACEAAGAIRTVASLTREDDCCNQYSESLEEPLCKSNRTAIWSNMLYAFSQSTIFFCIALVFWYGAALVSRREFSTFDFFVGLMSTMFGAIQAGNVFAFVPDVSSAKGAGSDILRLLDSVPKIDSESTKGKKVDTAKAQGHIHLENVHFRYPTRPGIRVLWELTLQVEPGTYIALVGASGSGKSTVIQLIERFYEPLAGEIYMDGIPIEEYNVQEYRKQIALVSQEPTLYAGTIRFNILLGAIKPWDEVTQEEIEAACRDANILDFIQGLPESKFFTRGRSGFDTEVGGKGSQLSGGQKQRIAIARALLRNPKVLLLDEATSALDSNSEKVVQAALDQAAKGRTTVAIAHRLSTIQNADRIYFIKEGRVSESGTHDQLINRKGDYYEYVQLQALSKRD
ncbi:P-loop containing nucleoside triphosphate hydrolase protein [Desarmillaria tabescens]|uniref:P-loop containing nucleoside triphosphate hydrolase protein n=1 Tax=Armillaria tabescens TaxID=1929756 RepID=A0AA39KAH3_ARMTA|nr:P-loop containing nucleoside triphosphate hydrolase protein [Desarmillaria tabescens]KAK0457582.1 P-loop containing nucleoside triphosphate hydrolase protein [Desarmillaria tabescens]